MHDVDALESVLKVVVATTPKIDVDEELIISDNDIAKAG